MTIQLDPKFSDVTDSTLIIAITGSPDVIKQQLQSLIIQMELYKKPAQGVAIGADYTTQIITPVWEGRKV